MLSSPDRIIKHEHIRKNYLTGRKTSAIMVKHDPLRSAQTTEKHTFRGSCQSGQLELTVNQPRKLRRFESFTAHLFVRVIFLSGYIARVAQR